MTTPAQQGSGNHRKILSLAIKDLSVLYSAYMPFIENGGLFIPTSKPAEPGEEVFMLLSLMEEKEKIPVNGIVVWITPAQAQGKRAQGIGVQFKDKDNAAKVKIESYLAEKLGRKDPTHTM